MKMVVAIINMSEVNNVNKALVEAGIKATKLSSSGAFMKAKNATFLIGVNDEKVFDVINTIEHSIPSKKKLTVVATDDSRFEAVNNSGQHSNVTIFILDVNQFTKF